MSKCTCEQWNQKARQTCDTAFHGACCKLCASRKLRRQVRELYRQSLPYMERFRQLAPEQKSKWVPVLYTIYLNLNMGQQFGEIDRIRSAMEKENTQ